MAQPFTCPTCGEVHPRGCTAHRRQSRGGGPYRAWAMPGSGVCWYHGGAKKAVRLAAERRLAEQEAIALMKTFGRPIGTNPVEALLNQIRWTAGHVQWLREQIQHLEADALTWGDSQTVIQGDTTQTIRRAATHVLVDLYQRERRHLIEACAIAVKAGIEERRVRLAESQGALLADLIRRLLDDPELGLSASQREPGRHIAANHMRVLSGTVKGA